MIVERLSIRVYLLLEEEFQARYLGLLFELLLHIGLDVLSLSHQDHASLKQRPYLNSFQPEDLNGE